VCVLVGRSIRATGMGCVGWMDCARAMRTGTETHSVVSARAGGWDKTVRLQRRQRRAWRERGRRRWPWDRDKSRRLMGSALCFPSLERFIS